MRVTAIQFEINFKISEFHLIKKKYEIDYDRIATFSTLEMDNFAITLTKLL